MQSETFEQAILHSVSLQRIMYGSLAVGNCTSFASCCSLPSDPHTHTQIRSKDEGWESVRTRRSFKSVTVLCLCNVPSAPVLTRAACRRYTSPQTLRLLRAPGQARRQMISLTSSYDSLLSICRPHERCSGSGSLAFACSAAGHCWLGILTHNVHSLQTCSPVYVTVQYMALYRPTRFIELQRTQPF